ncbi:hypothetical protein RISK_005556 [Rhodopirellula islandica]|uniref:Uncharacterized protein n=1 Tax=Rhodopirellula islandica TaxID=595434 RepID=A0A0J1B6P5_RHOIS|nr:hypothetical protein [Rhodopirellula islandica]KLU02490.1 hypothetical protein RISK_005556 [Rhodopirellula islandica]
MQLVSLQGGNDAVFGPVFDFSDNGMSSAGVQLFAHLHCKTLHRRPRMKLSFQPPDLDV